MIKQVIRLVRPGLFLPCFEVEKHRSDAVLIRPRYLSICAADQRYFQGNRPPEVLAQKLPLALFHEAVGEVLKDPTGELATGSFCVLLPGGVDSAEENSNYRQGAFFRSSNADGFCQELMYMDRRELIPVPSEPVWPYVFTELMSVCVQGIRRIEKVASMGSGTRVGIWGDGAMAFMMALTLFCMRPKCKIIIYGKYDKKLNYFSFANERINISSKYRAEYIDIAIETIGNTGSSIAINNAINDIKPTGTIILFGVSESEVKINTRKILEKGINIIGTSRSTYSDFVNAINLIKNNYVQNELYKLISINLKAKGYSDITEQFIIDQYVQFKSILELNI